VKFAVAEPESEALQAWREQLATDDVLMTCDWPSPRVFAP